MESIANISQNGEDGALVEYDGNVDYVEATVNVSCDTANDEDMVTFHPDNMYVELGQTDTAVDDETERPVSVQESVCFDETNARSDVLPSDGMTTCTNPPTRDEFNLLLQRVAVLEAAHTELQAKMSSCQCAQPQAGSSTVSTEPETGVKRPLLIGEITTVPAPARKRPPTGNMTLVGGARPPNLKAKRILVGNRFQCEHCAQTFASYRNVDEHLNLHYSAPARVKCDQCTSTFSDNSNLRKHVKIVHLNERFLCGKCNKTYATHQMLKLHIECCHAENAK